MIKKFTIGALIILVLALIVNATASLTVDNNIPETIALGQTGTYTLTLTNNGDTDTIATLQSPVTLTSSTNSSNKLTAGVADTSLNVVNSSSNSTTITVDVPSDAYKETYLGNLTVTYNSNTNTTISQISVTVVDPSYSINTGTIDFGTVDQNQSVSTTFNIENTGNAKLTNVNLSSANIASKYNVTFDQTTPFDLDIDEIKAITISAYIPFDEQTGEHSIGSIDVISDQSNFTSAYSLNIDIESKLIIDRIDVDINKNIDGNSVSDRINNNGDTIDEKARPGSEVKLEIKLKNQYTDDDDIDIDDIVITATLKEIEEGEDIEEEIDEFGMDADSSDTKTIIFNVPLAVERNTYDLDIHVEGEDDNGIDHEIDWTIFLEVDKKAHEVSINELKIVPSTVKCSRSTTLDVELINTGKRDEDEVKLEINNGDLDINVVERKIDLAEATESDDAYEKSVPIKVDKDVGPGTYPITVKVYYNDDILDDYKIVNLIVEECPVEKPEEPPKDENETIVVQQPTVEVTPTTPTVMPTQIPTTTETSFTESPMYLALILVGNIIVVVAILFLVAKFLLMKKQV